MWNNSGRKFSGMIKLITPPEMDGIMSNKASVQHLSIVHKEGNSIQDDAASSPTNRRVLKVNQSFSRNIPSARSHRASVQLIPLQQIINNVEPSKRTPSRQAVPKADIVSTSINDSSSNDHHSHPLRAIKHQPKILYNPHLPSVFTNEKPRLMNANLHANPSTKMHSNPPINLNDFVPRPTQTRDSVRKTPARVRPVWKAEESVSVNSTNPVGSQSHSVERNTRHIAIFKKLMSKFSDGKIRTEESERRHSSVDRRSSINAMSFLDQFANKSPRAKPRISLNEMITLKKIQTPGQGATKRMLHVPTLNIYDVQEEPIRANEGFKEWMTKWISNFNIKENKHLQKIFACFWNSPEGYVSIVKERAKNGNLQNVLDYYNTIPENCIQQLAASALKGLGDIHSFMHQPHGSLQPSEVIFDSHYFPKLSPGISHQLANTKLADSLQSNQSNRRNVREESSGKIFIIKSRASSIETLPKNIDFGSNSLKQPLSNDTFDLGYLLLTCALGNLDFFDMSGFYSLENLKSLLETISSQKRKIRNSCCLLHSEEELRRIHAEITHTKRLREFGSKGPLTDNFCQKSSKSTDSNQSSNKKISAPFTLLDLLTKNNRFSDSFIDFLCHCLQIEPSSRCSSEGLLDHEFLSHTHTSSGPLMSLSELISTRTKQPEIELGNQLNEEHLDRICEAVKIVLLNPDTKQKMQRMMSRQTGNGINSREYLKISELAVEIGVPAKRALAKFRDEIFADEFGY